MAKPTIRKQIELPAGAAPSQVTCRLRLVATNDGSDGWGYVAVHDIDVAGLRTATPDATGLVAFTSVRPNSGTSGDQIDTPTGTAYQLVTKFPNGATITEYINVTDVAGPLWVQDILTAAPSAVASLSATYVAKAGDTMTGALVVDGANITTDEGNAIVKLPAVPSGLEGFYVKSSANATVALYGAGGMVIGDPTGVVTTQLAAGLTLDAAGANPCTLDASGGAFTTNGKNIVVASTTASPTHALNENTGDLIYLRLDGITSDLAASPETNAVAIYSQSLGGSALMVVDDHGHRAPVGTDPHHAMQYTRLSPTNAGGGDAAAVGARWDSLTDTDCINPAAGLPPAWGLSITSADATKGCNTNVALFRRGAAGTLGDGWKMSFTIWTPDTLTTWTTPGASEGTRLFVGMSDQNPATIVGSDDPTGHRAGLSFVNVNGARGDTAFFISTKDGSTETLTATGMTLAASTVYEVILQQIDGGNLAWQVRNLTADTDREVTAATVNVLNYGSISATLPTAYLKAAAALRAIGGPDKTVWMNHLTITA